MTTSASSNQLELSVRNFGPIAEGIIELRPMTVFVGPSNSGKSYMAALIYALHSSLGVSPPQSDIFLFPKQLYQERLQANLNECPLSEEEIEQVSDWLNEAVMHSQTPEGGSPAFLQLQGPVFGRISSVLEDGDYLIRTLNSELARCFAVEGPQQLARYPSEGNFSFTVGKGQVHGRASAFGFQYLYEITQTGPELRAAVSDTLQVPAGDEPRSLQEVLQWLKYRIVREVDRKREWATSTLSVLTTESAFNLMDPLSRPAFYLPADRAGVVHAHRVVVRALIAGASRSPLRPDNLSPSLSGVIGDFLEQLVTFAGTPTRELGVYERLARSIETKLICGDVRAEPSEIDYPSFVYRPIGWEQDLPMVNASSMVSELAPVVLYFRHLIRPGNLLIIEEPEAHLHPEMQVYFARQLAAAVQSGVRILITTHSEWILEELANLVRLSDLPIERRKGIEDGEIALCPDQLGAWFFEPDEKKGGSVVREISLDEESATFPSGFGLVTESLYNRWVEITTRIQEE